MNWLKQICAANGHFQEQIDRNALPTERQPCPYAIVTCMDPRVNPESFGIQSFTPKGELRSRVRVIRTIGGIAENRSLVVGIHLAGFKEIAIIMHTDCGCSLAYYKVDQIIANMQANLGTQQFEDVKRIVGEPLRESLLKWLHAFQNPRDAVNVEVKNVSESPFVPDTLIIHGLVYDLFSGGLEIVVNGYAN
jgi:carbonic anhydrase